MNDELFSAESVTVKSPRLRWMEKYKVQTHRSATVPADEEPWSCWSGELQMSINHDWIANGTTEDEAITAWAIKNGVRKWNEE